MYDELLKRLRNRRICIQQLGTLNDYPLLGEAADAIEELSKPRWIPVTERLPDTEDEVVVAFKNSADGEWWYRIDNFVDGAFCYNAAFGRDIAHWMPLPQPPEEEQA